MGADEIPYKFLEIPAAPARGSVTNIVTESLRNAIVTLELDPGEVLDEAAICERLGVSRFPVSEALSRLQGEGLVDILPRRGSMVSRVRIADVVEFMLIRRALESEAIRVLIARQPEGIVEELQRSLAAQAKAASDGDHQTFHNCDVQFHEILFESMQFSHIHAIIDRARANLTRARLLILDPR